MDFLAFVSGGVGIGLHALGIATAYAQDAAVGSESLVTNGGTVALVVSAVGWIVKTMDRGSVQNTEAIRELKADIVTEMRASEARATRERERISERLEHRIPEARP